MRFLVFIVSLAPTVALFLWLRTQNRQQPEFSHSCDTALIYGILCTVLQLPLGALLALCWNSFRTAETPPVATAVYRDFIVAGLCEELLKYLALRLFIRHREYRFSRREIVVFSAIVSTGFGLVEHIMAAISDGTVPVLLRGVTMPHTFLGFIMGWFYGMALGTGKRWLRLAALLLPFALHGLFDFSQAGSVLALSENMKTVTIWITVTAPIVIAAMTIFVKMSDGIEKYTCPVTPPAGCPEEIK